MAQDRPAKPSPTDADPAPEAVDPAAATPAPDDGVFDEVGEVLDRVDELVSEVVDGASDDATEPPELNDFLSPSAIDAAVEQEMTMPADDVGLGHELVDADSIEEIDEILADGASAVLDAARAEDDEIDEPAATPDDIAASPVDDLDATLAGDRVDPVDAPDAERSLDADDLDALVADGVAAGLDPAPETPWDGDSHERTPPAPPKRELSTAETNAFGKALDDALAHADEDPPDDVERATAGGDAEDAAPGRYLETPAPVDPEALDVEFDAEIDDLFDAELEAAFVAAAEAEGRDRPEMPPEQAFEDDAVDEAPSDAAPSNASPSDERVDEEPVEDPTPDDVDATVEAAVDPDDVAAVPAAPTDAPAVPVVFESGPSNGNDDADASEDEAVVTADEPSVATSDDASTANADAKPAPAGVMFETSPVEDAAEEGSAETVDGEPEAVADADADGAAADEADDELPEPMVDKLRRALVPWQTRGLRAVEACAAPMELVPAPARLPVDLVAITLLIWVPIVWALALFASPEPRADAPSVFDRSTAIAATSDDDPHTDDGGPTDGTTLRSTSNANAPTPHPASRAVAAPDDAH